MKKYKLIKEYPGSLPLGSELYDSWENTKKSLKNYPDFWQKILFVERNYKILALSATKENPDFNQGRVIEFSNNLRDHYCKDSPLRKYWKIHSIQRLSDNEIFTIGDVIRGIDNVKSPPIKKMEIDEYIHGGILIITGRDSYSFVYSLKGSKRVNEALFITRDNVKLFEGDTYYYIINVDGIFTYNKETLPFKNKCSLKSWNNLLKYNNSNIIKFSKKELAEKYIFNNTKRFSLNDLKEEGILDTIKKLKEELN